MSPIAKIEIAIAIPIFIKNWDRDRDPDRQLKMIADPDLDRCFAIADLLSDLLNHNKGSFSSEI